MRGPILHRQRPRVMSWLVGAAGVVNVLAAALLPQHEGFLRLEEILPFGFPDGPRMLLFFTGLLLLAVAGALRRAQRPAWWTALVLLLVTLVLQLHLGLTRLEAGFALAFLLLLVAWKEDFPAPSEPPSRRVVAGLAVGVGVGAPLLSWLAVLALRREFPGEVSAGGAAVDALRRLVYLPPLHLQPTLPRGRWLLEAIPLLFWTGVLLVFGALLRAVSAPRPLGSERARARQLALRHGCTGQSFMASRRGNSLFFPPGGGAFLAYRVHAGLAVVLGDPVGPPEERAEALDSFLGFCEERGWSCAVLAATTRMRQTYADLGFQLLKIGEEAVLDLGRVEFKGRKWQNMRTALNRAEREGIGFQLLPGGRIAPPLVEQMREMEEAWRRERDLPPLDFTQGRVEDVEDPAVLVAVAVDAGGRVQGYVDWLPIAAERGWVLDLMRRRRDAMPGTMDFLIGRSLLAFQERGDRTCSLAAAPLADLDRDDEQSLVPRLLGVVFERFQTFYDFRALFDFKERFEPRWEPVYLAHRDPTELPAVAVAILRAHLPQLGWAQATRLLGEALVQRLRRDED